MLRFIGANLVCALLMGAIGVEWLALALAVIALATAAIAYKNTDELFDLIRDDTDVQATAVDEVVEKTHQAAAVLKPDEE